MQALWHFWFGYVCWACIHNTCSLEYICISLKLTHGHITLAQIHFLLSGHLSFRPAQFRGNEGSNVVLLLPIAQSSNNLSKFILSCFLLQSHHLVPWKTENSIGHTIKGRLKFFWSFIKQHSRKRPTLILWNDTMFSGNLKAPVWIQCSLFSVKALELVTYWVTFDLSFGSVCPVCAFSTLCACDVGECQGRTELSRKLLCAVAPSWKMRI